MRYPNAHGGDRQAPARLTRMPVVSFILALALALMAQSVAAFVPQPPPRPPGQGVTGGGGTTVVRQYGLANGSNPAVPTPRPSGSPTSIPPAPQSNRSYYITTLLPAPVNGPPDSGGKGYGFGQQQGQSDHTRSNTAGYPINSAVVLAFGKPHVAVGSDFTCPNPNGFGTRLLSGVPACRDDIKLYVENWIEGYISGLQGDTGPQLTLVIGVNNSDNVGANPPNPNDPNPGAQGQYDHVGAGQDWGNFVNEVNNYDLFQRGYFQVAVYGGDDIEDGPSTYVNNILNLGFEPPNLTRSWVDGYHSTTGTALYDFGDSGGCPGKDHSGSGLCNGAQSNGCLTNPPPANNPYCWYQRDIWYVALNNGSNPLPEIYSNPPGNSDNGDPNISQQASEWEQIALYDWGQRSCSDQSPCTVISFLGSLTQYTECIRSGCPPGTNNTASNGWIYLYKALNDYDVVFLQDRQQAMLMAQSPPYVLDIAFDNLATVP